MASRLPTARQLDLFSLVPQLAIMGLLIAAYYHAGSKQFLVYGILNYLVLSFCLRNFIPLNHRTGMRLIHKKQFEAAITYFQGSYTFFSKYDWLDSYRYVVLMSSSKMTYKEMALLNIAFCYSQVGDGESMMQYYNKTLREYPDNETAKAALKLIDSVCRQQ